MLYLLGLSAALGAFILLLAAMQRHQLDLFGMRMSQQTRRYVRLGGFALIFVCWLIDALGYDWGAGTVTALGHLTLAAILSIAVLHVRSARRKATAQKTSR